MKMVSGRSKVFCFESVGCVGKSTWCVADLLQVCYYHRVQNIGWVANESGSILVAWWTLAIGQ
jgi:hypothetical protein